MLQKLYDNFMKAMSHFFSLSKTASVLAHLASGLKLPALIAIVLLTSGCAMSQFKQREASLNQQQKILAEQQQQLQKESDRLGALEETLSQEQKRLAVLKKSLGAYSETESIQSGGASHVIIGELENVYLTPPDIQLSARIDTGAKTSSLNAIDMVEFERDGKAHVRFNIIDPASGEKIEVIRRVIRHVKIKEHEGESQSRPVVKIRVRLGNLDQRVRMTLTDRSEFKNQVLIGRNFLQDFAIVDVSQKFQTKPVINDD
jgi:hypothetical protein